MVIKIGVPDSLLSRPAADKKRLETVLQKVLLAELALQGALDRETAARAAEMPDKDFNDLLNTLKIPASAYQEPASRAAESAGTNPRIAVFIVTACIIVAAAAIFLNMNLISSKIYCLQGRKLLVKGDTSNAEKLFLKALKADGNNFDANGVIGVMYVDFGERARTGGKSRESLKWFGSALPFLLKAAESKRPDPNVLFDAGYAFENLGDREKAGRYYKMTLGADPDYRGAELRIDNLSLAPPEAE
jgi:tetratricopeptide (TPR) repeat protein